MYYLLFLLLDMIPLWVKTSVLNISHNFKIFNFTSEAGHSAFPSLLSDPARDFGNQFFFFLIQVYGILVSQYGYLVFLHFWYLVFRHKFSAKIIYYFFSFYERMLTQWSQCAQQRFDRDGEWERKDKARDRLQCTKSS